MKSEMSPAVAANDRSRSMNSSPRRSARRAPVVLLPAPPGPINRIMRTSWIAFATGVRARRSPSAARNHDVRSRRPRVHDPDAVFASLFGQAERGLGRAGDGNRHFMRADVIAIGTRHVIPDGTELGLRARALLVHVFEHRLGFGPVTG